MPKPRRNPPADFTALADLYDRYEGEIRAGMASMLWVSAWIEASEDPENAVFAMARAGGGERWESIVPERPDAADYAADALVSLFAKSNGLSNVPSDDEGVGALAVVNDQEIETPGVESSLRGELPWPMTVLFARALHAMSVRAALLPTRYAHDPDIAIQDPTFVDGKRITSPLNPGRYQVYTPSNSAAVWERYEKRGELDMLAFSFGENMAFEALGAGSWADNHPEFPHERPRHFEIRLEPGGAGGAGGTLYFEGSSSPVDLDELRDPRPSGPYLMVVDQEAPGRETVEYVELEVRRGATVAETALEALEEAMGTVDDENGFEYDADGVYWGANVATLQNVDEITQVMYQRMIADSPSIENDWRMGRLTWVNQTSFDMDWTRWVLRMGENRLVIYAESLEDALDEAIDWAVANAPGLIVDDEVREEYARLLKERLAEKGFPDESLLSDQEKWDLEEEAADDTTQGGNASNRISSDSWYILAEGATVEQLIELADP